MAVIVALVTIATLWMLSPLKRQLDSRAAEEERGEGLEDEG